MRKGIVFLGFLFSAIFSNAQGIKLDLNHMDFANDQAMKVIYSEAKKARVVFTGENHTKVELNSKLEYYMLKGLYQNCGYKNFILEMSASRAYYMERYVCKNDSNARRLLNSVASEKYMRFFDHLNQWMQTVPENERIHFYGLDVERFCDLSFYKFVEHINSLKGFPPKQLFPTVEAAKLLSKQLLLENETEYSYDEGRKKLGDRNWEKYRYLKSDIEIQIKTLVDSITLVLPQFKAWLGKDYQEFLDNLNVLNEYFNWKFSEDQAQQYLWREEMLYRNFSKILMKDTTQKFFGQFGRCHVAFSKQESDCGWFNYHSVSNKIRNRVFHGDSSKIVSIAIFYQDNNEELAAVNEEKNDAIRNEIDEIKAKVSKDHLLFDLHDTANKYEQLRKKFRFVLSSGTEIEELEPVKLIHAMDTGIMPGGYVEDKNSNGILGIEFLGISYLKTNLSSLQNHFQSVYTSGSLNNPSTIFISHGISFQKKYAKIEFNGMYGASNDETLLDYNLGSLHYSSGGLVASVGTVFHFSKFSLDLMPDFGVFSQKIENHPKSLDLTHVNSNWISIVSNSWIYGGHLALNYAMGDPDNKIRLVVGLKCQVMSILNNERWQYEKSQQVYQDFGAQKSPLYWSTSLNVKLYFFYSNLRSY